VVGSTTSISSDSSQPTSATQSSFVPGLTVKRNGFLKPYETMRRAFASALPAFGLPGAA
jgi:hypothetical protein